ncbi:hypothetical protein [Streptomyces yangpuensis]|uniref:hypothetical protein n=1 Tax=Streptomyces yangpuensis TaxID=1648182 RepID=UPI00381A3A43
MRQQEVGVVVGERGRGADGAPQHLPGGLGQAAAGGLLSLPGDGTPDRPWWPAV